MVTFARSDARAEVDRDYACQLRPVCSGHLTLEASLRAVVERVNMAMVEGRVTTIRGAKRRQLIPLPTLPLREGGESRVIATHALAFQA